MANRRERSSNSSIREAHTTRLGRASEREEIELKSSDVLEAAPDAMVVVGPDGRIRLVNGQAERLFGYNRTELVGQLIEILVPPRYRNQHPDYRTGYFVDANPRPMGAGLDLHGIRKDGTEFPAEISLAPVQTAEGMLVTAAIRDVTDRKKVEAKFRGFLEAAPERSSSSIARERSPLSALDSRRAVHNHMVI